MIDQLQTSGSAESSRSGQPLPDSHTPEEIPAQTESTALPPREPIRQSRSDLAAQLAEANVKIAELTANNEQLIAAKEQLDGDEIIIRRKMSFGLSHEQAAAVIRRQRDMHRLKPDRFPSVESAHQESMQKLSNFRG